jgi:hypothetical protein
MLKNYDLHEQGMVQEGMTIADYIKEMVKSVLALVGEDAAADYKFYMHPDTWKRVVDVYACCTYEGDPVSVPIAMIEHLRRNMVYFKTLTVDGVTYSVVLDAECEQTDIWFMADPMDGLTNPEKAAKISKIGRD